jgi:hypothetical protein
MKKLIIAAAVFGIAAGLGIRQHSRLAALTQQNRQLTAEAGELKSRAQRATAARLSADQKFADLRHDLRATLIVTPNSAEAGTPGVPPPDPSHQGGWPRDAAYFYLPKEYLTNVSYNLLNGDRVTDEAAALLGMTSAERESVNRSFGDLLSKFRLLEIERMQQVPPPEGWLGTGGGTNPSMLNFSSALVYKVPDLGADLATAQAGLSQQLQQILGDSRAQVMQAATDAHLRQNMDDLGAGERTVGFVWNTESDGSKSLWYAIADARNGEGSFQRVPTDLDPNSQTAYYAKLMGVKLPGQN